MLRNYPENPALGKWCDNQRTAYENNKLAQDKIKRLDDLGFIWDRCERHHLYCKKSVSY